MAQGDSPVMNSGKLLLRSFQTGSTHLPCAEGGGDPRDGIAISFFGEETLLITVARH